MSGKEGAEKTRGFLALCYKNSRNADMDPVQIVIDTNVLVCALRSRRGASALLMRRLRDPRMQVNVSSALLLEYEAKLKDEMMRQGLSDLRKVDRFLDALAAMANRRSIYFSFRTEAVDPGDAFLVDLAVASGARFVITYNLRHLAGIRRFGKTPIRPGDFLRWLETVS